jgi:hypothetical protein
MLEEVTHDDAAGDFVGVDAAELRAPVRRSLGELTADEIGQLAMVWDLDNPSQTCSRRVWSLVTVNAMSPFGVMPSLA